MVRQLDILKFDQGTKVVFVEYFNEHGNKEKLHLTLEYAIDCGFINLDKLPYGK